ncbi:MAG: hypothetical protein MK096_07890 [Oleiphilaceae bacterium]|nr:hypothetical protein [Oleiphilaceae bacterium]
MKLQVKPIHFFDAQLALFVGSVHFSLLSLSFYHANLVWVSDSKKGKHTQCLPLSASTNCGSLFS